MNNKRLTKQEIISNHNDSSFKMIDEPVDLSKSAFLPAFVKSNITSMVSLFNKKGKLSHGTPNTVYFFNDKEELMYMSINIAIPNSTSDRKV